MSDRREHGPLSDPKAQGQAKRASRYARRRQEEDLLTLARQPAFRRFIGQLQQRCGLTDDFPTNNGGELAKFMGRRLVAIEVLNELENVSEGFYMSVLQERMALKTEIERIAGQETPNGNPDE